MTTTLATYTTVASLQADTTLTPGQIVQTLGYSQPGLGGNTYEIIAVTGTPDSGSLLALDNSAVMARGLFPGGQVNVSQFGALAGTDSSDAFADALAFAPEVQVTAADQPYQISRELTASTCRRLLSDGAALHFTAVQDQRGLVFGDSNGLRVCGFSFTSQGRVDQYISAENGVDAQISDNSFDFAGCTGPLSGFEGGVYLKNTGQVRIHNNSFKGGWRDHNYHAGTPGNGNNMVRTVYINNYGQSDIVIRDNRFNNVWTAVYAKNCNSLYFSRNIVEETADTAFFDRCTAGVSKKKRFVHNEFSNIGKAAIKTLDTNNDDDNQWAEDAIVDGNTVHGWGVQVNSECILSGRNHTASGYKHSSVKARQLKIINNTLLQQTQTVTHHVLKLINVEGVVIANNTINPADAAGDTDYLSQWCKNVSVQNNDFTYNGKLYLAYAHEGRYQFNNNSVTASAAVALEKSTAGISQQLTISNNQINNTGTVTASCFGLGISNVNDGVSLVFTGNRIRTTLARQDSNESTAKNMITLSDANTAIIDNNLIEFSDALATQKMIAGDIICPVHYAGMPGAARIYNDSIQFQSNAQRKDHLFSLSNA